MIKVKIFSLTGYKWVLVMTHVDDVLYHKPHTINNFVEKMYKYVEW